MFRVLESKKWPPALGCGLLFGLGALAKQPGLLFGLFAAAYLAWQLRQAPAKAAKILGVYCAGLLAPAATVCAAARLQGVWREFWFWNFRYSALHGFSVSWNSGEKLLIFFLRLLFREAPLLWLLALSGLLISLKDSVRGRREFLLGLALVSGAIMSVGFYFRSHYFIFLLPALALSAAAAMEALGRALGDPRLRRLRGFALTAVWVTALEPLVFSTIRFCRIPPDLASAVLYHHNPFREAPLISDYILAHSARQDTVLVLGSESEICFYSRRRPATKFMEVYQVMEDLPGALERQEQMIHEAEDSRPKFVVEVFPIGGLSWKDGSLTSEKRLVDWSSLFLLHYRRVGLVSFDTIEKSTAVWGPKAARLKPTSDYRIEIFERGEKWRAS
jgi:hypothetical protein